MRIDTFSGMQIQDTGCDLARECVKALYRQSLDGYEGIDALR